MSQNTEKPQQGAPAVQTTDLVEILPDMGGGILLAQLEKALSDAAINTLIYGDKGKTAKVSLEFSFSRIGESSQVAVRHTVTSTIPTKRGKSSELATTETAMHVGPRGRLSHYSQEQPPLFDAQG